MKSTKKAAATIAIASILAVADPRFPEGSRVVVGVGLNNVEVGPGMIFNWAVGTPASAWLMGNRNTVKQEIATRPKAITIEVMITGQDLNEIQNCSNRSKMVLWMSI